VRDEGTVGNGGFVTDSRDDRLDTVTLTNELSTWKNVGTGSGDGSTYLQLGGTRDQEIGLSSGVSSGLYEGLDVTGVTIVISGADQEPCPLFIWSLLVKRFASEGALDQADSMTRVVRTSGSVLLSESVCLVTGTLLGKVSVADEYWPLFGLGCFLEDSVVQVAEGYDSVLPARSVCLVTAACVERYPVSSGYFPVLALDDLLGDLDVEDV
jgi:hypothetical protein